MKVKVIVDQDKLDNWNVPDLETGCILDVEKEDDYAYLIVDKEYDRCFWLGIPQGWCEVIK